MELPVDIESFWTEGYAGQTPNSGHELAIMLAQLHTKCIFHDFFVCLVFLIDLLSTDLSLLKDFSKNVFEIVLVCRPEYLDVHG